MGVSASVCAVIVILLVVVTRGSSDAAPGEAGHASVSHKADVGALRAHHDDGVDTAKHNKAHHAELGEPAEDPRYARHGELAEDDLHAEEAEHQQRETPKSSDHTKADRSAPNSGRSHRDGDSHEAHDHNSSVSPASAQVA